MSDTTYSDTIEDISKVIDLLGVAVIVLGLIVASVAFVIAAVERAPRSENYRLYRQRVGKAILLGLEFLVAADIIRTVAVEPSFRGVGILALIVLVRTFLSFTLEVEIEGRWPWQKRPVS